MLPGQLCHIFIFRFPVDDAKAFRFFDSDLTPGGLYPLCLTAPLSVQDMAAWLLEAFCIVAVNVYMMISGYFLCESSFKLSRLLTLWLQLWLYSVGIGVLAVVTGIVPAAEVSTHYYLTLLFPVTMGPPAGS